MNKSLPEPDPQDNTIHLLDYIIVIAKRSRFIIFGSMIAVILTYFYLFFSPNTYKAVARIVPPQQNLTLSAQLMDILAGGVAPPGKGGGALGGLGGLGGLGASLLGGAKTPGDIYASMMKGDTIFDRISERFQLNKKYPIKEDARAALGGLAKIRAGKDDGFIYVEVTDKDPQRAAVMANAFVDELNKLLHEMALQEAEDRSAFLEKQRDQVSLRLVKAEEELRTFAEQKGVIQIDAQTKAILQYIASLRATIDAKEVQITVMRQHATPSNYDVINMEAEVRSLKEKLQTAEKRWDQSCISDVCLPSGEVPSLGLEYLRLLREVKFQSGLYTVFSKMVEIARLDMAKNVAVIQVIDRASVPQKRANKRLFPSLIVGIGVFFILVFIAFMAEYIQGVKQQPDEHDRLSALGHYLQPWKDMLTKIRGLLVFRKPFR